VLERLRRERGLPEVIVTDNGSEFTSRVFDAWAYARGVRIDFIQPGKPVQNCFVESFNGTFRDDCLNLHWFLTLAAARIEIEAWRREYNTERPHSSLARLAPATFARLHAQARARSPAGCQRDDLGRDAAVQLCEGAVDRVVERGQGLRVVEEPPVEDGGCLVVVVSSCATGRSPSAAPG